jgi:hypothetical protein
MSSATTPDDTANLGSAAQLVSINLGLDQTPSSQWTASQRIAFLQSMAQTILQYPDRFTDQSIANANATLAQNLGSLQPVDVGGGVMDYVTSDGVPFSQVFSYYFGDTPLGQLSQLNVGAAVAAVAGAIVKGTQNFANALSNSSNVLTWALPIALLAFLYFASRSVGNDPGGQSAKTLKGVRALY